MNTPVFVALRRMRRPLIVLIVTYAIAIVGLTLIPGVDGQGMPWRMSFFHAFYFVSYTANTIGFGELPHEFSDGQRMWVIVSIYLTVLGWFYAIGNILQLTRDPAFRHVVVRSRFERKVAALSEPFYVICGYGETGSQLVDALDHFDIRTVVIDGDPERASEVELGRFKADVPTLTADLRHPDTLLAAGLGHPRCAGVIALTSDDEANLAVAVTVKLLRPRVPVLCRCESHEVAKNMASFGTDYIVNPFELFGRNLGIAIDRPGLFLLREWLTALPEEALTEPRFPPRGQWILCGYGRFGREVAEGLEKHGNTLSVIELDPQAADEAGAMCGRGTEAETLEQAGIRTAVGIVAGTSDDVNNLSIVMTARELVPDLFVVLRQNRRRNGVLANAVGAQFVMQPATVVVHACMARMLNPMLGRFLRAAESRDNAWANELVARIAGVMEARAPETWMLEVDTVHAPALVARIGHGPVAINVLLRDPQDWTAELPTIALAMERESVITLLPDETLALQPGDRLLFCGRGRARRAQLFAANNPRALNYLITGSDSAGGWLWSRFSNVERVV
ncbi:MAG: NAD-binding protein [Burkholderiales bacterium]|nr:NAD-binding protein [Burkholderiales bacterium]